MPIVGHGWDWRGIARGSWVAQKAITSTAQPFPGTTKPMIRQLHCLAILCIASGAIAAEITLDDALRLAKERNGTVVAAYLDVKSAQSSVRQAKSSFLPSVTPRFSWSDDRVEIYSGPGVSSRSSGSNLDIAATWKVLDSGQRQFRLASAQASALGEEAGALLTLRNQLVAVTQNFYDSLRAKELLRVQQAQFDRATLILNQTKARAEVGDIAKKDILQAEADQLNAQVSLLGAQNDVKTSLTALKTTIGWGTSDGKLELKEEAVPAMTAYEGTLDELITQALANRPDLIAARRGLDSQRYAVRIAKADAGLDLSVDATYNHSFYRYDTGRSGLGLSISFPLYDGGSSRENVRQRELAYESARVRLGQSELDVRGDVEQAYYTYDTNVARLAASQKALEAARKNFEAASRSQALGASSLIEVQLAQTSLVTAEVNAVQAVYDALISEVRLRLAIGVPLRGE